MEQLTVVQSYYDQPQLTDCWWKAMRAYPDEYVAKLKWVFVDDGSPRWPLEIPDDIKERFSLRHFRVTEDIAWNEMGARNLAMKNTEGWVLMLDADYTIPRSSLKVVFSDAFMPVAKHQYVPKGRRYQSTDFLHYPINLFFIHTDKFWEANGYDEDFAGHYGFSDTDLLRVLSNGLHGGRYKMRDIWLDHYQRDQVENASVQWLDRNLDHNAKFFQRKVSISHKAGVLAVSKNNKHLKFSWEEVT